MPVSIVVPAGGGGSNPFGDTIDLSEMSTIATARMLGNISGGNAVPSALTLAQVLGFLGTGTPGSGNYLRGDGSWQSISGGKIAQVVSTSSSAVATGTTAVPLDDTTPQNTEGTEFLSLEITPTNASSVLEVLVVANLSMNSGGGGFHIIGALFVDSTANALQAFARAYTAGGDIASVVFTHRVSAGSTSARTYKFRAGPSSSATITLNGAASARRFGGVMNSYLIIREVLP